MAAIDAIFFDLGDTITDLGEGRGDYEARVLARAGRIYDLLDAAGVRLPAREVFCPALAAGTERHYQDALAQQKGIEIEEALRLVFAELGIALQDGLLSASAEAYCRGAAAPAPLRQGAEALLARLHALGLKLGVISNTIQPGRYLDASLERRGILGYFAARIYSSDVGLAKPHPGIFKAALAALDVRPQHAIHVGDRLWHDVAGAQAVGMKGVLIRVPGRLESSPHIVPDACIDELLELLAVLPGLGS